MEKIKVIDKRTGAIKEIKKALAGDFIGTGNFEIYKEEKANKGIIYSNKKIVKEEEK